MDSYDITYTTCSMGAYVRLLFLSVLRTLDFQR